MWIALGTYFCSKICTNVFKPDELKWNSDTVPFIKWYSAISGQRN
jgi:hypothetical protein